MTRRALRKHCFEMLFNTDFCAPAEADGRINTYLCEVPDEGDESPEFSEEEWKVCRECIKAVLDEREKVDGALQQTSSGQSLRQMGRVELTIFYLTCFEPRFDENIPEKIAINKTVELARKFGREEAPSFVNDVLTKLVWMATTYTVTRLNVYIGGPLREDFLLAGPCMQGKLPNVKYHANGHIYSASKNSGAELRGAIYRQNALGLDMRLADDMQVVCTGAAIVYKKTGVYQLNIRTVERLGQGGLYTLYQARFRALEAEGLLDAARKKPLPCFVPTLDVMTSSSSAVIHDIQTVACQQSPYVKIVLYPALMQGENTVESITRGIWIPDRRSVNLMIMGRSGGLLGNLWRFNDERVVQAAYACKTPLISMVGHESDVTLLDFVAGLHAATSSAAAKRGVPNLAARPALIVGLRQQLSRELREKVGDLHACTRGTGFRLRLNTPEELPSTRQQRILALRQRFEVGLNKKIQARRVVFQLFTVHFHAASPLNRLTGGYVHATHASGIVVQSAASLSTGERLSLRFLDGVAKVRVGEIRGEQQKESHGREAWAGEETGSGKEEKQAAGRSERGVPRNAAGKTRGERYQPRGGLLALRRRYEARG